MSETHHRVVDVSHVADDLFELTLERNDLQFAPGDCVAIFDADESESRPYSIASGTQETVLRFIIRAMPDGVVTSHLKSRRAGESVTVSQPFGWFRPCQDCDAENAVFVATGTGIAPFLSYCRSHPENPPGRIVYGVRRCGDAYGFDDLIEVTTCHLAVSRETPDGRPNVHSGRVTDHLDKLPLSPDNHYYLCGLDAMINDVNGWLEANGIDFFHVHREVFFNAIPTG